MTNFKICNKKKYIVGLSGGPDSIFLLDQLIKKVKPEKIIACHVNYHFRKDSNIDQKICEEYCRKNSVRLLIKNVSENYQKLLQNFEKWARNTRYDFFKKVLQENNFDEVLIAHNQNDDVETLLMQIEKKSLVNFYGIARQTNLKNMSILRPILDFKKSEILKYLKGNNINYAIDSTNTDVKYKRNAIRSRLSDNKISELLVLKNTMNQELKKKLNKLKKIVAKEVMNIRCFKYDLELLERALFFKIQELNLKTDFYNRKKQTIKEISKQLYSTKSYIKIKVGELLVIKDREDVYCMKATDILIIDKQISKLTQEEIKFFKGFSTKKFNENYHLTNDWEKYKNELSFGDKTIGYFYKKHKVSYWKRFFIPMVYEKSRKKIVNNALINDKIKSMS